ncbi:MAG: hypothetical protein Q7S40_25285 [Opitutaceae bacterium]|nr:hypothetical protein [Opitutaceae bacterium]
MKSVTAVITDFDQLARASDDEIIRRFVYYCHNSKKQLVPKNVASYGSKVQRQPELLTIGLFNAAEKQVATFSFAPVPPFRAG